MYAAKIINYGSGATIKIIKQAIPKTKTGEALIKVYAAGINRPDLAQKAGRYNPPTGTTDILGLEIAGEIIELNGESKFSIGDNICGLVSGGGYAEYCTVPIPQCMNIPNGYDFTTAAALPETFMTVWVNIFEHGKLQKGETLLIHGGSSGIGTTAIQLGKAFGAKVVITAGSDEKCNACKELGANIAINYKKEDFVEVLKDQKVDVVLDMIGGDYLHRNLKVLNDKGRHVSIAGQRGWNTEINIFDIMSKRLILTGSTLRPRSIAEKSKIAQSLQKHVWSLLENKTIAPVIYKTFSLFDVEKAHKLMESSKHIGKIVLKIKD